MNGQGELASPDVLLNGRLILKTDCLIAKGTLRVPFFCPALANAGVVFPKAIRADGFGLDLPLWQYRPGN